MKVDVVAQHVVVVDFVVVETEFVAKIVVVVAWKKDEGFATSVSRGVLRKARRGNGKEVVGVVVVVAFLA